MKKNTKAENIRRLATLYPEQYVTIAHYAQSNVKYVKAVLSKVIKPAVKKTKKSKKATPAVQLKQYVAFVRDHSGSMSGLRNAAMNDYNNTLATVRQAAIDNNVITNASVVKLGVNGGYGTNQVHVEVENTPIGNLPLLTQYEAVGGTPLFDAIGRAIENFKKVSDKDDKNVSFLIFVTTDGEENQSRVWTGAEFSKEMAQLVATDRWTFAFRVPKGYAYNLVRFGVPSGNILEWEQTERGYEAATQATKLSMNSYYSGRTQGFAATKSFYKTDLSNFTSKDIRNNLKNISSEVIIRNVHKNDGGKQIRNFIEEHFGETMVKGAAFYQLTKTEKQVQDYKVICIRNKASGEVYSGSEARTLLGLPTTGTIKIVPGDHGSFDIYIQSTSVNRKLVPGTCVLYWKNAVRKVA